METQLRVAERSAISTSIEYSLDSYLDGVADATMIFRSAVDAHLHDGSEGACWQLARRIADLVRGLEDMQQALEMRPAALAPLEDASGAATLATLTGLGRLLRDMKRQVTGLAIESGFTRRGRRVPAHLAVDVQELTDEVCAAIDALVETCRPERQQEPAAEEGRRGVGWHEAQADRLSMALLRRILADEALDVDTRLLLAQFVEEIDRVADQAEAVARELPTDGRAAVGTPGGAYAH
ncbi:hypothetical protein [Accumulibacter sp.]|uniref:hypothetical protein n=1 Tax=Accumulibacter sp. TaxID=2053492 RepID=UPI0025FF1F46|nr:hypothetical protein [Accumulibacter sp.]MCM8613729.1 hypothetical protein [Accumulibacter sp.]MCM8637375.1 hypothetical protein [Accumulibacter sp.]MCM8640909.1 hypothetical protein [Accumulibacter sp.]